MDQYTTSLNSCDCEAICLFLDIHLVSKSIKMVIQLFLAFPIPHVQEVAAEYDVRAMPTFLFIKDGQQIDKVVGADRNDLERKCNKYATSR